MVEMTPLDCIVSGEYNCLYQVNTELTIQSELSLHSRHAGQHLYDDIVGCIVKLVLGHYRLK